MIKVTLVEPQVLITSMKLTVTLNFKCL